MRPPLLAPLLLLALAAPAEAVSLEDLHDERQEELYYDWETLPATVRELVAADIRIADMVAFFEETYSEKARFNVVLIVGKKLGRLPPQEIAEARAFLVDCLEHPNPWVRTEAVFAVVGPGAGSGLAAAIAGLFDDPSDLAFYHAVESYMRLTGERPELDDGQADRLRRVEQALLAGHRERIAEAEWKRYVASILF